MGFLIKNCFKIITMVLFFIGINSCKKTTEISNSVQINPLDTITNFSGLIVPRNGEITFSLSYFYDNMPLVFDSKNYTNAAADTFTILELKHYLTNIILTNNKGDQINLKNYHLLDAKVSSSTTITIQNVPAGNYTSLSFLLAVDSARNHGGLQEGALDPAYGMFWTWNTGYIFYRINGITTTGKNYSFDIGGDENLPEVNIDFSSKKVKSQHPKFGFKMEVSELYKNPNNYSFKNDGYTIHSGIDPAAKKLSDNMKDMVTLNTLEP